MLVMTGCFHLIHSKRCLIVQTKSITTFGLLLFLSELVSSIIVFFEDLFEVFGVTLLLCFVMSLVLIEADWSVGLPVEVVCCWGYLRFF